MQREKELSVIENTEAKNNEEQPVENKETDPFAKGRERMASISGFFARTKEKASSLVNRVGGALSHFGSRAKSFGGEAVAATLSADVLAKKGYDYSKDKAGEAKQYVVDKKNEAVGYAGGKIDQASEWASEKGDQFADWTVEKGDQFTGFVESKYETARDFTKNKAEQVKGFTKDKIELTKDAAFYAKNKTQEGLLKVKNGVENRYNKVKTFGENAFAAAKVEAARVQESYRRKMNEIRLARLQAEHDKIAQKESAASQKAEQFRQQRESLAEKMGLLQSLEMAA